MEVMLNTKTHQAPTVVEDHAEHNGARWAAALPAGVILANDVAAFALAFLLSGSLVGVWGISAASFQGLGIAQPLFASASVALVTIAALAATGHYAMAFLDAPTRMTLRGLGIVSFAALIGIAGAGFVDPSLSLRATFGWMIVVPLFVGGRIFSTLLLRLLSSLGVGTRSVLVVGSALGVAYATQKLESHGVRHRVAGSINLGESGVSIDEDHLEAFQRALADVHPGEVLIAAPPTMMARIEEAIRPYVPRYVGVRFAIYPLLEEPLAQHVDVLPGDLLTMRVRPDILGHRYAISRRVMDIPIAVLTLLLTGPLMVLVAIAIKLDSPGPVLFRQTRVGRNGRTFTMYKFRSMRMDAEDMKADLEALNEAQGPLFKLRNDPRVTRVGRIIRRLSIDELPQFFNVLEGTMGVVGPRPALPNEVAEYEPWQLRRLAVLPGITGLWQVSRRQCSSFDEMIWLDIEYVEKWSPMLDLGIVLKTIPAMVTARGAY